MKLWIDDYRPMPVGFDRHVRTVAAAKEAIQEGIFALVSFDYHLGGDDTWDSGLTIARWVASEAYEGRIPRFQWAIHSDSKQGAAKIRWALEQADKFWTENEMQENQA